jgi:DNA polymerase-1
MLWEADYSQLELRIAAAYAREQSLIEIFADPSRDVFSEMALELGWPRFDTKTFIYSIQYGAGLERISNVFNVDKPTAAMKKAFYYDKWPGFEKVTTKASVKCRQQGYITLWSGRRRHFQWPENEAHKAANSAMQGGAAEIVKRAMIRVNKLIDPEECSLLLQVHDSMVFEIEEGKEDYYGKLITESMAAVEPDFGVVFRADWHKWGE